MPPSRGIVREGYPFIAVALGVSLVLWIFVGPRMGLASLVLPVFVINFFRDPERTPVCDPSDESAVISPADGTIMDISEEIEETHYLRQRMRRICIFMNVFNVHVNRIPWAGTVKNVRYNPGKFLLGYAEKASLDNEQNGIVIEGRDGKEILFVQIAGLVARRIVCYLKGGETVRRGERFGLIRFGSRVDVYLPLGSDILVKKGMKVKGGMTPLAKLD